MYLLYLILHFSPRLGCAILQLPTPNHYDRSVVVLLLPARQRQPFVDVPLGGARGRAPLRLLGGVIAAVFAAADLLLRVQPFEDEIDGRRDRRLGRLWIRAADGRRARRAPARRAPARAALSPTTVSDVCSEPPRSNHSMTRRMSTPSNRSANTFATDARISSRATLSAPFSSPSYSISNLPVIDGSAAYTSVTRGTTCVSPLASARRSAFDSTFSRHVIARRWLTPERRSILRSARA